MVGLKKCPRVWLVIYQWNSHSAPAAGDGCYYHACFPWPDKEICKYSNQILGEECKQGSLLFICQVMFTNITFI